MNEIDNQDNTINNSQPQENVVGRTGRKVGEKAGNKVKQLLKNKEVRKFLMAHIGILLAIIAIIVGILILIGLILFFINMPGLILGKIDQVGRSLWSNVSGIVFGDSTSAKISKDDVIGLAQYIQNMGYDIDGCGFGIVEYEKDSVKSPNQQRSTQGAKEIKKIGKNIEGKQYLKAYIAANTNSYVSSQKNLLGGYTAIFEDAKNGEFVELAKDIFNTIALPAIDETNNMEEYSTGMINVVGQDGDSLFMHSKESYADYIEMDAENQQMRVYNKAFNLPLKRLLFGNGDTIKYGEVFSYDLNNWTSRYGRPLELMLALHLSTMMPDLPYQIATNKDFNTKVNIGMENIKVNYDVVATKEGNTLNEDEIKNVFLEKCLSLKSSDNKNYEYDKVLKQVKQKNVEDEFFEAIYKQIEDEHFKVVENFVGVNFIQAKQDANGHKIIAAVGFFEGVLNKLDIFNLYSNDADTFVYINRSDEEVYKGWTYKEIEQLAELVYQGSKGIEGIKWPYIISVEKHWFYNKIDFNENKVYRLANKATKVIDYYPEENSDNPLKKDDISVKLNAEMTSDIGIVYQVCEPDAKGPNKKIKKLFQQSYYKYDGTVETAKKIENSKALDEGESKFTFNGEKIKVSDSDKISKQKVSFEDNKENALAAFSMLQNMHTEAGDYIYRNLKELVVALKLMEENDVTEGLKNVALWPIDTDNQNTTWDIKRDEDKFSTKIYCNEGENTIIAPGEAIVKAKDDNSITLEFTDMSDKTVELLEYIYEDDKYTKIDKSVLTGIRVKIENVKIKGSVNVGDTVTRGQKIGEAKNENGESRKSIYLVMYNIDKTKVDDIYQYFRQDKNSKYENIMTKQKDFKGARMKGVDISGIYESTQISGESDSATYSDYEHTDEMTTAKYVWEYFAGKGWDAIHIAGVLGNFHRESGCNPKSKQGSGSIGNSGNAIGIGQWDVTRATGLVNYAKSKNVDWTNLDLQLDYLQNGDEDRNTVKEYLSKKFETPEAAAIWWCDNWEKPGVHAHDIRTKFARMVYNKWK